MLASAESEKQSLTVSRFDWVVVVLAGLIVFCAAASIAMAEWMPDLDMLIMTVVVGWGLGSLDRHSVLAGANGARPDDRLWHHLGDADRLQRYA